MPRGRLLGSKPGRRGGKTARPGAARALPLQLMARMPVIRRLAGPEPPAPPSRSVSARRVLQLLKRRPAKPAPPRLAIPFVSPMIRGVSRPIERTAAVVRAAREVRKPRTRWERLRETARLAIQDPTSAARWEQLVGLGVGLVAGKQNAGSTRALKRQPAASATPRRSLSERLQRLGAVLNDHAGPRGRRHRQD